MAESLKTFFSKALVARIAASIERIHPDFPSKRFVADACRGLDELELLDRARKIADALHAHLPPRYPEAVEILLRSLGAEHATDELQGVGMAPFFYLPHTIFVATHGLDDFETSMRAQHELTRRFSCEFSIRAFIGRHPDATLKTMQRWATDKNAHVRRLVSEGTRPRLPWASRVPFLDANPERVLQLLELLKDDPASVVRRSVANHLNDLSKTAPELAFATVKRWLKDATPERRALVEHAMRSAIKRGDPRALGLLGFGATPRAEITDTTFSPKRVSIGEKVRIGFTLHSTTEKPQDLVVDLVVHFVKANGQSSPKVFKVDNVKLKAGQAQEVSKVISLAVHTTRTPYPGRHRVDAQLNGTTFPLGAFTVVEAT